MPNVSFTWAPNPELLAKSMEAVAASLERRAVPLAASSEFIQEDIRERFTSETAPDGSAWQELSESYVWGAWPPNAEGRPVNPRRRSGTTLKDTGELMRVATSSSAQIVTNDAVFYQTSHLPDFGLAHQFGLPGRSHPLPARPFIGMSNESAAKVWAVFSDWFDGSIRLYPTSTGKVGMKHSIRGGGPKGNLFASRASVGKGPLPKF